MKKEIIINLVSGLISIGIMALFIYFLIGSVPSLYS